MSSKNTNIAAATGTAPPDYKSAGTVESVRAAAHLRICTERTLGDNLRPPLALTDDRYRRPS